MKKNYNPFKMWLTYLLGILLFVGAVIVFYWNMQGGVVSQGILNLLDSITPGELSKTLDTNVDVGKFSILMINPISMIFLFVYGFILGWIIQSIGRALK